MMADSQNRSTRRYFVVRKGASSQNRLLKPDPVPDGERIFIPAAERGRSVTSFEFSVRFANVLRVQEIRLIGELHGLTYREFGRFPNCGRKTTIELRNLVRQLQAGAHEVPPYDPPPTPAETLVLKVPAAVCSVALAELPLSVRLRNGLKLSGYRSLGDLEGFNPRDLLKVENCGRKCVGELHELIRRAVSGEFSAPTAGDIGSSALEAALGIDVGVALLPARNQAILEARFVGNDGFPRTLEDVGSEFKLTRERVRQITKAAIDKVRRGGGPKLSRALESIEYECCRRVCPLTPELFAHWQNERPASTLRKSQFYVRAIETLRDSIPTWPSGPAWDNGVDSYSERIGKALEKWMRQSTNNPTAAEAYRQLREQPEFSDLDAGRFLSSLRRARRLIIDFPALDQPQLRLRRLRIRDFARAVLAESSEPLTTEQIVERAKAKYGEDAILVSARSADNSLTPEQGFFLLGPRSIGLRRHFTTSEAVWPKLRDQLLKVLKAENRPLSTIEVVDRSCVPGFEGMSSYEMAQILREDPRFMDLGRQLFALSKWGIEERDHIKDLIPRVLLEADRVLTVPQVAEHLRRLRSASLVGLAGALQRHPKIRSFGFGFYGLRDWDDSKKEAILRKREVIEGIVRRATPPVSFMNLCGTLGTLGDDTRSALLWATCAASSKLRRAPDRESPETLLLHKSFSLEQAIAAVSRSLQRAAPAYELQWELNARFGEIFSVASLSAIEERLARSGKFLRNNANEFLLDEDLDYDDFDADALRAASIKSLMESNDIAGCDELIERLEMQGFELEELSADMLASVLRGAEGLQEVAHQRFRARQ